MTKPDKPSPKRSRAIDPQQRAIRWAKKGQTKEARLFGALRRELIAHVGGNPSAAERALIDRCAMLQTHLARMDEKLFAGGDISDHGSRQYLAWANSVSRMLQALGLKAPAPKELTAADGLRILREQYGVGGSDE